MRSMHLYKLGWLSCTAFVLSASFFLAHAPAHAQAPTDTFDLPLLQGIHKAAKNLDYSGVIVYSQGNNSQSMRLVHVIDGTGERERLEVLDGLPREFLRQNDVTQCLVPDKELIIIERRSSERFPAFLLGDPKNLGQHYTLHKEARTDRVAGRECDVFELSPKDEWRYGYRLCADSQNQLLLRLETLGPEREIIDQVTFASVAFGEHVNLQDLHSPWKASNWKVIEPELTDVNLYEAGWRISMPAGFSSLSQVRRSMRAGRQASHMVLADGLAAISVFLESVRDLDEQVASLEGAYHRGAMNMFRMRKGDFLLTTTGEVPMGTLRSLAEQTEFVPQLRSN